MAVTALCAVPLAAQHKVRIIQTNSAGDNVHLIDPATNKVVGVIEGIEVNHGATVAPDGSRLYISNEADNTLDFVDAKTLKVTKKVKLSGHPNNLAVSRDGRRVYIGIREPEPGGVDVVDTASFTMVKTLPTQGAIHNAYVTPDGKYVVAGSISGETINVFDAQTEKTAWTLKMDLGVRPMTFVTNPDGSTKWILAQLSGLNGFAVVDFATRKEIRRIENPASSTRQEDGARRVGSLSWHGGHLGRQDARRLQPLEQSPLLLFVARPEGAGRRRAWRHGRRLGHAHA